MFPARILELDISRMAAANRPGFLALDSSSILTLVDRALNHLAKVPKTVEKLTWWLDPFRLNRFALQSGMQHCSSEKH